MIKKEWAERRKQWEHFNRWESDRRDTLDESQTLHLIGEMVDFYLKLNPEAKRQKPLPADYGQGIKNMHRLLAVLKI